MSCRRKILIVAGIVFGVAILLPVLRHYQLRFAVESYVAELKAKGEPMELAQVIPPPVPPEQNAVPFIFNSLTNLEARYSSIVQTNPPTAMCEVLPGKAMVRWRQPAIIGFNENTWPLTNNLMTNTWEDLEKELAAEKDDLDSFQSLTNHPILDFNLDYGEGYPILRHLARIKHAADWLSAAALYDLHERRTAEACAEVHTILAIAKGQTEEPLSISQQVRDAVASVAAQVTWEILQDPNVSESDLASLQQDLESIEFVGAAKQAFLAERVINLRATEHYLQNPSNLWRGVNGNDEQIDRKICKYLWQEFWAYSDEKRMMQLYQVLADAMRMAETNHSFQTEQGFVRTNFNRLGFEGPFMPEGTFRIDIDPIDTRWLSSENAFDSFSLLKRTMIFETARNLTIVAIALKRYELQNHQLPSTLNDLTPLFLKMCLLDYMNGEPLHYQKNSDGTYLLYSVGENGVDDGGKPSSHKWWEFYWFAHTNDLVWPQPATEAEIKNFYDHPPK